MTIPGLKTPAIDVKKNTAICLFVKAGVDK